MGFEEQDIRTDVELLKKDVHSISRLVDKLDVAIDKLTDVTNCLNRMIAVQEEKLASQEAEDKHLHKQVQIIYKRVKANNIGYTKVLCYGSIKSILIYYHLS